MSTVLYGRNGEKWTFNHRSVAWRLIRRVLNATSGNAKKPMMRQSVCAKKNASRPTSDARNHGNDTIKTGARTSFGRSAADAVRCSAGRS
jgi:hypothetical protein